MKMKGPQSPSGFMLIALLAGIFLLESCASAYVKEIRQYQKGEEAYFSDPEKSPLREAASDFKGLKFYKIHPEYRYECELIRPEEYIETPFQTSSEKIKVYHVYAYIDFVMDEEPCRLTLFRRDTMPWLFLPFKDHTNGDETYGGGRYMEFEIPEGDSLVVDFNKAFNPYCAYSDGWSCPVVPKENHLDLPVRAGVIGLKGEDPNGH